MKNKREYSRHAVVLILAVAGLITCAVTSSASFGRASARGDVPSWSYTGSPNTATLRANGKIAFTSNRDDNREIYVMNADGTNQVRLTNNSVVDDHPAWSPDGTKIAFVGQKQDGSFAIFAMNGDGTARTEITSLSQYFNEYPSNILSWSPDGSRIAFQESYDILVVSVDGNNRQNLTNSPEGDFDPSWSPDGSKILFSRNGTPILHTIKPDGTDLRALPNGFADGFGDYSPSWSPSGNKIAFVVNVWDFSYDIFTANADGTNRQFFDGCGIPSPQCRINLSNPAWSPDGNKIVFSNGEVCVKNIDGTGFVQLTNGQGGNYSPSWQPLASAACPNSIDCAEFFVRQHYFDFLSREPDAGGLAYWTNEITQCGSDAACVHRRHIGVSAAFFIEQEFQETGYFVYRFYKASFDRPPNYDEFTSDRSRVTGGANGEASKQAFADEWVQRPAFVAAYPITMSNTEFVNKVFDNAGMTASRYDLLRQQEILAMNAGRSRALILRDVIEIADFKNIPDPNDPRYSELKQVSQYNPAFVLMQYFGYLRRNVDQNGFDFWLDVVNNREPNNYRGMVCAFITSSEYQLRFGSVVTSSNADCGQ